MTLDLPYFSGHARHSSKVLFHDWCTRALATGVMTCLRDPTYVISHVTFSVTVSSEVVSDATGERVETRDEKSL